MSEHSKGPFLKAQKYIDDIRNISQGKTIAIWPPRTTHNSARSKDLLWDCIRRYCSSWFGFTVVTTKSSDELSKADLVITDKLDEDHGLLDTAFLLNKNRVLMVCEDVSQVLARLPERARLVGAIRSPIGPFKLARSILKILSDPSRQPASPEPTLSSILEDISRQAPVVQQTQTHWMGADFDDRKTTNFVAHLDQSNAQSNRNIQKNLPQIRNSAEEVTRKIEHISFQSGLPDLEEKAHEITMLETPVSQQVPPGALHILAVDDNDLNLQLLKRYLKKRKQDIVVTARNGVEAVTAVHAAATPFDIILMDISMPEMDGFEATRLIRKHERSNQYFDGEETRGFHSHVVALTGLASRRDRDEARESGLDDFMTKPIPFAKVGDILKRMSEEKMT